jgi:hypothetical protein
MIRAFWRWGLAVAAGALLGCAPKPMVQQKAPPPDPLLVTKKPIEGKPTADDGGLTARLLPPAPPAPAGELASHDAPSPVRPAELRLGAPAPP